MDEWQAEWKNHRGQGQLNDRPVTPGHLEFGVASVGAILSRDYGREFGDAKEGRGSVGAGLGGNGDHFHGQLSAGAHGQDWDVSGHVDVNGGRGQKPSYSGGLKGEYHF